VRALGPSEHRLEPRLRGGESGIASHERAVGRGGERPDRQGEQRDRDEGE
jgi:hypothetical protein